MQCNSRLLIVFSTLFISAAAKADFGVAFGPAASGVSSGLNLQVLSPVILPAGESWLGEIRVIAEFQDFTIDNVDVDASGNYKSVDSQMAALGARLQLTNHAVIRPYLNVGLGMTFYNGDLTTTTQGVELWTDLGCDFYLGPKESFFLQTGLGSESKHADRIAGSPVLLGGPSIVLGFKILFL